jgi:hypothetical protein
MEEKELQLGTLVVFEVILFTIGLAILPVSAKACLMFLIIGNVVMAVFTACSGSCGGCSK